MNEGRGLPFITALLKIQSVSRSSCPPQFPLPIPKLTGSTYWITGSQDCGARNAGRIDERYLFLLQGDMQPFARGLMALIG